MTLPELKAQPHLILLECVSGSRAYGLDTPESDTDIRGVFYLPKRAFYGLHPVTQVNDDANNQVYYELGKYVELLLKNNPNMLELLATPASQVLYRHPLLDLLQPADVLSRLCYDTFTGYAMTQVRKAQGYHKKAFNPVEPIREDVLSFCYVIEGSRSIALPQWLEAHGLLQSQCGLTAVAHTKGLYNLFVSSSPGVYQGIVSSPDANEVSVSGIPKGTDAVALLFFNAEHYSAHCKSYRDYWDWVARRNESRYTGNQAHGKEYDAKNMMHTIRLLQVAEELIRTGALNVHRSNRDELLDIKKGHWSYEALLQKAEDLLETSRNQLVTSPLPESPNTATVLELLFRMRSELYA
jgi:predicted nucleotidyltransferase